MNTLRRSTVSTVSRTVTLGLAATLVIVSCSDGGPSRSDAVAAVTASSVPARYSAFADEAADLTPVADEWCVDGDAEGLLDQVEATRVGWVSVSPFWFGPVSERRSRFVIDPIANGERVGEIAAGTEQLGATALRDLYGADQRGLAAVELLVEIVGDDVPSEHECEYAQSIVSLVEEEADALAEDWQTQGSDFAVDDDVAGETIESMVNEVLFSLTGLEDEADDEVATAQLSAMRWALLGDDTVSTRNTEGISALLDDEVVDQLDSQFAAASGLDPDALMELELTITTNVVSSLGLSVQFSDADGDG